MNSILDDIELQALQDALEDEYKAHTTYDGAAGKLKRSVERTLDRDATLKGLRDHR